MSLGTLRRLRSGEEGESLISFALTVPILFGVMFGLMQMCLAYYNYERISELAREGTRYAMLHGSTCTLSSGASCTVTATQIESYVTGIGLLPMGGASTGVVATFPDGNEAPGSRVKVVVSCNYPYKIPFVASNGIAMSTESQVYILQ